MTVGTVSNVQFNDYTPNQVVGNAWPTVTANPDSTTFSYDVTASGATLASGSNAPSTNFWQYDLTNTKRTTVAGVSKNLKL